MDIEIKVIAGAKKRLVKQEGTSLKVYLTAPAVEGQANKQLIEVLAQYFNVRSRQIVITKGLKSRNKTISIGAN